MSSVSTENLNKEKIQQLLASVGSQPAEDSTQIEASEYNWQEPHCFTREQLSKLDEFTKTMCKTMAAKFSTLCPGELSVTIDAVTQQFADKLVAELSGSKQDNYYLAFGDDPDNPCGLIGVPAETAFAWATQLLGDSGPQQDTSRDLSQLEESLLLDIASAMVEALCEAHPGTAFQPAKTLVKRLLPIELQGTEELCKMTLTVTKAASDTTQANILILCAALEPIVGKAAQDISKFSAADTSKALREHLEQTNVSVAAQLAATELPLKELISLCAEDVLVLEKRIDEPLEVIVEGRPILEGRVAKSAGKYAVVIGYGGEGELSSAHGQRSPDHTVQAANPNENT
ncbi:MAG: FliM/FliN family flagellar motor switch protein [Planctomycetota bacterium]|jgi:flagellar motor switch protein FliM